MRMELISMPDRWGVTCHVSRVDFESGKPMLRLYRSTGLSVATHNELMRRKDPTHIHRDNLRPDGYDAAAEDAKARAILAELVQTR